MSARDPFDASDGARLQQLETLDQLLPVLSGVLDIRDVFAHISSVAQQVLPHDFLGLPLMDADGIHVRLHAITGAVLPEVPVTIVAPDPSVATRPWEHVLLEDIREDWRERDRAPARAGHRSLLRIALRLSGRFLGALDFYSTTPGFYRESDIPIARRLGDYVVLALSHQRMAEDLRRSEELRSRAANVEL